MGRASAILLAPWRAIAAIPPATRAVAVACLAVHLLQRVVAAAPIRTVFLGAGGGEDLLLVPDVLSFLFAISGGALSLGFLWTPVTYLFLHAGWSHLLLNGIGLLVFGSAVEREAGCGAFWAVWLGAGIAGGAGWALAQGFASPVPCVGASAAVLGLAGAFAALRPRARFAMLLPVPAVLPAWALAAGLFALNALELAFVVSNTAYLAHLVGIAAGAAIGLALRRRERGIGRG
jgi:membrane associated rhomboid family serine protease